MGLNVHILPVVDSETVSLLRKKLDPQIVLSYGSTIPSPAQYQVLVGGRLERSHLDASPALKTVIIPWSGLPQVTRQLLLEFPHLAVHNLHHNAVPTAELAITLMVTVAKGIVPIDRSLRRDDWTPRYLASTTTILKGKTVLILGYGAIGREIATICEGFQMKVLALRRQERSSREGSAEIHNVSNLNKLLPKANVLFISLPFTPETREMVGREGLSLLPDGAILVNIARGPIVDERALYEELKTGRIRAGLDVWYNYPRETTDQSDTPPSRYPFSELDNVVMTPHLAGHSEDTENMRVAALAELLNLAVAGESLPNSVDPKRGY